MRRACLLFAPALLIAACAGVPPDAFKLPPSSLADRQLQSRLFATTDHTLLLASSVAVLQDLGFALDETNSRLGLLTASKELSAKSTSQTIGMLLLAALTGTGGAFDDKQKIRVCLVVTPAPGAADASVARITIQRIVWDTQGLVTRVDAVTDPELYQTFFAKLERATFLEANPT
jgi:hypothetical protein